MGDNLHEVAASGNSEGLGATENLGQDMLQVTGQNINTPDMIGIRGFYNSRCMLEQEAPH